MSGVHPSRGTSRTLPWRRLLTAYPLACFTGALITDIAYVQSVQVMWADFSIWLIAAGMALGTLAALLGGVATFTAHRRGERIRLLTPYAIGTALMLALGLVNAFVHSRDGWTAVVPAGITLSAIVALLALVTSFILYARPSSSEVR